METYLSKRTTPSKPKKDREETGTKEFKEEAQDYYQQSFIQRVLDYVLGESTKKPPVEDEKVELEEDEKELEEYTEKKGFLSGLRNWFLSNDVEQQLDERVLGKDVKEILKIGNKWLSKLPTNTMKQFKDSNDYEKYKETLKRYKLIKEH